MERILVVGGLSGIGKAVVDVYPERSLVWSRRTGVDASDEASVQTAARKLLAHEGPPFAVVHAVGDFDEVRWLESDLCHYRQMIDSNLTSTFLVVRALAPAMAEQGRGRIVLFGAAGAEDATAKTRAPIYFAAKAALLSLARSLALELAPRQVTVNVISPGIIRHAESHGVSQDRMEAKVPLGRAGSVADVLGAVDLLLSDAGAYITGANLTVDGGLSLRN